MTAERFRGRGLEILSVSFDSKRDDPVRFRQGKWAMPWLHAFAPRGFGSEVARAFEIAGIPRPVLVDPSGTIVAADEDLRREKLEETLERLLGGLTGESRKK